MNYIKLMMMALMTCLTLTSCFDKKSGTLVYKDEDSGVTTNVTFENTDKSGWIDKESLQTLLLKSCESSKSKCKNPLTFKPINMKVNQSLMTKGVTNEVVLTFQCSNSLGVPGKIINKCLFDRTGLVESNIIEE